MSYNKQYLIDSIHKTFDSKLKVSDFYDAHLSKLVFPEQIILKIQAWLNKPTGILFFAGNPGIGKSYLCAAICFHLIEKEKYFRVFRESGFFSHLHNIINQGFNPEIEINTMCDCEYFILDDIGSSVDFNDPDRKQMTEWEKKQVFNLLDHRASSRLPTVITSNLFLNGLDRVFSERFSSRIKDKRNVIIEENWIDKRIENF